LRTAEANDHQANKREGVPYRSAGREAKRILLPGEEVGIPQQFAIETAEDNGQQGAQGHLAEEDQSASNLIVICFNLHTYQRDGSIFIALDVGTGFKEATQLLRVSAHDHFNQVHLSA
jgi:hypothetical protein